MPAISGRVKERNRNTSVEFTTMMCRSRFRDLDGHGEQHVEDGSTVAVQIAFTGVR